MACAISISSMQLKYRYIDRISYCFISDYYYIEFEFELGFTNQNSVYKSSQEKNKRLYSSHVLT